MGAWLDWILPAIAGGARGYGEATRWLEEQAERKREEDRRLRIDEDRRAQQALENQRWNEQRQLQNELAARKLGLEEYGLTADTLLRSDALAPSFMEGGILPSENLSPYPAAQAPNRLAPAEIPGVPSLGVPGAQLPRRFREDVQKEKIGNLRAEAAAKAEETRAASEAAWPMRQREIEERAKQTARYRRPLQSESAGAKPPAIPAGVRSSAVAAKHKALQALEKEARTTGGGAPGVSEVGKNVVMSPEELAARKLAIENEYREKLGMEPLDELGSDWSQKPAPPVPVRSAQPAPSAAPTTAARSKPGPRVGERRMIAGQVAEWDGRGWKAVR